MENQNPIPHKYPREAKDLVLPEVEGPLYDLTVLDDPPDDWEFLGFTLQRIVADKGTRAAVAGVWTKFHLWGITYKTSPRTYFKKDNCKALWKYFYYMQERHRPSKLTDLYDLSRDSGPRLLNWHLNPRPPPISRRYPKMPSTTPQAREQLGSFERPRDAPDDIPDTYLAQMMYSAGPLSSDDDSTRSPFGSNTGRTLTEKRPAGSSPYEQPHKRQKRLRVDDSSSPIIVDTPSTRWASGPPGLSHSPPGQNPPQPGADFLTEGLPDFQVHSPPTDLPPLDLPSGISAPRIHIPPRPGSSLASPDPSNSSVGPPPEEPDFAPNPLRVEVEKLLMKHAYGGLQRHPEAPQQGPIPNQIATQASDLAVVQSGASSSVRAVRIHVDNLEFSAEGSDFPYRGRGPVGSPQSCFIDCVIMVGKLLDAGCTVADRKEGRSNRFTDIERAFIEITNMNWDAFDDEVSKELRDTFHRLLCTTYPQLTIGHLCPPWSAWSVCTKNFEQFRYYYTTEKTRCMCKGGTVKTSEKHGCFIGNYLTDEDSQGVTVSKLVERSLPARKPDVCKDCGAGDGDGGPSISKRITRLPLRLVVLPILGTKVVNHTDLLEFAYLDGNGKSCKATYRWLGGIYFHGEHARVWWNDAERGEMDLGNVRMYDGTQVSGTMFGGIPAIDINERVHLSWVHDGGCPPMLFYEQVLNPTFDMLFTAMDTVNTMSQMVLQDKQVLMDHTPWVPSPSPPLQRYPGRYLPSFGDPFINSKRPDPFDTLPPEAAFIDIRDWVALRHINENDPRLAPFKEQMALIPSNFGDPPTPPPDTRFFDTLLQSPFGFVDQPDLWLQGPPDTAGISDFPDLPSSPDARPMSMSSQASGTSRFTFADWLTTMNSSRSQSSASKSSQSTDTSMRSASFTSERSAKSDARYRAWRQMIGNSQRALPGPKHIRRPSSASEKQTRDMREEVLIKATSQNQPNQPKRVRIEDSLNERRLKRKLT